MTDQEQREVEHFLPISYDFRVLSTMLRCFQLWRPLESLDENDGTAIGKMLIENTSRLQDRHERSTKGRREKLDWFFGDFRSMKSLKDKHPWFETMMEAVIIGHEDSMKAKAAGDQKRDFDKLR